MHAVTSVATFFIPVDLFFDTGLLSSRPGDFALGFLALEPSPLELSLELLNSNAFPIRVTEVQLTGDRSHVTAELDETTLAPFLYTRAVRLRFDRHEEGEFAGSIVVETDQTAASLRSLTLEFAFKWAWRGDVSDRVLNGSISSPSPIFYPVPSDPFVRIASIPVALVNHFAVPVAVTHVGIPDAVATLVGISDRANFTRFVVSVGEKCDDR